MKLTLRIWRQTTASDLGSYETYLLENVSSDLSLLEALDQLNEQLISSGRRPVSFEHDCREGICGSCGFLVNGQGHGPRTATSVCQLYLREFSDGAAINLAPWQAKAFPTIQDLMVDRSALDRIIAAGGYCSTGTGQAPDANAQPIGRQQALKAFDTATCIGCGACVASFRNASASLFVARKLAHLGQLPQGQPEQSHGQGRCKFEWRRKDLGAVAAIWNAKRCALRKSQQTGLVGCTEKDKRLIISIPSY